MFTHTQYMTDDCMGAYKTFTKDEHTRRLGCLQKKMARHGCDVLLLTSPENITYVTGDRTWYFSSKLRPVICVVAQTGEPALVLRILEESTVQPTLWTPHVYCWGSASRNLGQLQALQALQAADQAADPAADPTADPTADPATATALAVRELAGSPATVGIEAGEGARFNAPLTLLDEPRTAMGGISLIDGARAIQNTRMISTEWEVSRLRKACGATEDAIETAFARWVRVGFVGNGNRQSRYVSPDGRASGKTTSLPIIAAGCWPARSCSPR